MVLSPVREGRPLQNRAATVRERSALECDGLPEFIGNRLLTRAALIAAGKSARGLGDDRIGPNPDEQPDRPSLAPAAADADRLPDSAT